MAEFRKQNALQTGFIMKTKFKMSISSLQPLLVYGLINCGLVKSALALLNIYSGMSTDALVASCFFYHCYAIIRLERETLCNGFLRGVFT
jgi:hypothetical protein